MTKLPGSEGTAVRNAVPVRLWQSVQWHTLTRSEEHTSELQSQSNLVCRLLLQKSTRLNSSHSQISYAVFCLKKKHNPKAALDVTTLRHLLHHRPEVLQS